MSYTRILESIGKQVRRDFGKGKVADYIPALARVPGNKFGMAVATVDGEAVVYGDAEEPFSIQSVSKVFLLSQALNLEGSKLWKRVGREPSGNPFNSLVQLEHERGIPRNPFINAGALVTTDTVLSHDPRAKRSLLSYVRRLTGNKAAAYDAEVAASEAETGHLNAAMAHFLKSHGNLRCEVPKVLDTYFHQCALTLSCLDLATAFLPLANGGINPSTGEKVMPPRRAKRINAVMLTCGLYDAVGKFAYRVGIPAKSGVGGGIVGVIPGQLAIAVWSPELDANGNSRVGSKALELFTTKTKKSIF